MWRQTKKSHSNIWLISCDTFRENIWMICSYLLFKHFGCHKEFWCFKILYRLRNLSSSKEKHAFCRYVAKTRLLFKSITSFWPWKPNFPGHNLIMKPLQSGCIQFRPLHRKNTISPPQISKCLEAAVIFLQSIIKPFLLLKDGGKLSSVPIPRKFHTFICS